MFANETRTLLTFREDVLGRPRVSPGLKLAEHQTRFTNACRSASGSGSVLLDRSLEGQLERMRRRLASG